MRRLPPSVAPLLLAASLLACAAREPQPLTLEHLPMPGPASLPFSAAVRAGPWLFLSGQLGTDSTLRLVPGGIGPETRQAMENVRALVTRAGGSMERLVKCTVMLADMAEWGAMNQEYVKFFSGPPPARSALGASGLALGARVEIECLALLEER
ncbi:MAG TPA: RidA family protein [Gemmatimonadales bacterium]|nr:RidA family protein [Gemmatimonadales bacterium]